MTSPDSSPLKPLSPVRKAQQSAPHILVVDDEASIREVLEIFFEQRGCAVSLCEDAEQATRALNLTRFDLALTDLRLPKGGGMRVLDAARTHQPNTPIVMMTAYASTATAIEAMKRGAHDYLPKPFELDALEVITQKALSHSALLQENERLKAQIKEHPRHSAFEGVIGQSAPMRALLSLVERIAPTPTPVLLLGESGTGKEVIAQAIHKLSPRASKPFVVVNCAALPDHLFESELFGHTRGAFTGALEDKKGLFQAAEGGTLLLDEIGEMPLSMQAKVLRAIQARRVKAVGATTEEEVNIRLLAATNRSLSEEVKAGTFREDLYYRLNVIPLTLPPLRERPADIPLLIEHFLQTLSAQRSIPTPNVAREVISALLQAPLPGNVRELKNLVERALTLSPGGALTFQDFMLDGAPSPEFTELLPKTTPTNLELKSERNEKVSEQAELRPSTHTSDDLMSLLVHQLEEERYAEGVSPVWSLDEHLEALEGALITAALERTHGNRTEAAKLLDVSFRSLRYRLKRSAHMTRSKP